MKTVDDILEVLQDGEWHDIEEIKAQSEASERKTEIALNFLVKYEFVEKSANGHKVRAEGLYMEFIRKIRLLEHSEVASATKI